MLAIIVAVLAIIAMVVFDMRADIREMQAQVYTHIPNEIREVHRRIDVLQESLNTRIDTVIELLVANQSQICALLLTKK